ncbi:DHH family phosphoesterase [Candidatus Woesearchaeota archaeon]|nr:DHH family phosphoesterase [Candidatus Woesearchaeota archaeon]
MTLTQKQIKQIKEELDNCKKPLFFFHDDSDGLCSFLLLYRYIREGNSIIVKTTPRIDEKFLRKVEEYGPDKIFIVDIALVDQEFIDGAKTRTIWIDHHAPLKRRNVLYFNPRVKNPDANIPVSYWCYQTVKQDMWIAAMGCVGDWYWPDFIGEFKEKYPDLLPKNVNDPETALFETKLGKLIKIMDFSLKGKTQQAMQCAKIFTRIKTPYEILNQETPAGTFLYKKYLQIYEEYKQLLDKALKQKPKNKILLFEYSHAKISLTKDLANELLHRFPDKIIIIAREKADEMKISLRSKKVILPGILEKALVGVEGFGGGHEHACGANIKKKDFERFVKAIEEQL